MLYFLALCCILKFQESKMHIGVKNDVSNTKSRLKPSTPKVKLVFNETNQVNL
jgi:hypothetical protein